jgi:hypothetical protein
MIDLLTVQPKRVGCEKSFHAPHQRRQDPLEGEIAANPSQGQRRQKKVNKRGRKVLN